MDGKVEHSKGDAESSNEPDPFAATDPAVPIDLGDIFDADEPETEPEPAADSESASNTVASSTEEDNVEFLSESEPEAEPEPEPEAHFEAPVEPQADAYDVFAEGNESSEPEAYSVAPKASDSPDLSDIAQFGNSESSGGRDGTLRYILYISGIDTSDVRMAFREALTDRKFLWDTDQILRSLKNGHVRIENVSATKAHVLITRLRNMPVKVRWEQYAIHQS